MSTIVVYPINIPEFLCHNCNLHKMEVKVNCILIHPYESYENTELWKKIDQIIDELVENQDIKETTKREYIVGYICKKLLNTEEQK